jgi:glucose-1-phosphate thymidylyltransferase
MFMIFADTLLETDLSNVLQNDSEAIAWVKEVPDPRRFGVAEIGPGGWVKQLVEKPDDPKNNLVVVGFYYFKDSQALLSAIEEQMDQNLHLNGEYFLADAINILLKRGMKMQVQHVSTWLDAGTPEALLQMNQYLLEHGLENTYEERISKGVVILPPVFIDPTAQVKDSIIGPHVSIGANCQVKHSIIQNSILEDEAQATSVILESSLVGRRARITRRAGIINAGDSTEVIF